jgi:drug/metabolite transporter (DMT)-like permease
MASPFAKLIGWILLWLALLGGLIFFAYFAGWDFPRDERLMGPHHSGGASNAPIMLGLFALAGAYLVSRPDTPDGGKDEG